MKTIADDPASRDRLVDSTMLGSAGTAADDVGIMVASPAMNRHYATGGLFTLDGGLTAL